MDTLRRLVITREALTLLLLRLFVFFILAFCYSYVEAAVYPSGASYRVDGSFPIRTDTGAIGGDCQARKRLLTGNESWVTVSVRVVAGPGGICDMAIPPGAPLQQNQETFEVFALGTCPSNSTGPVNGVCTCSSGYIEEAGSCVQDNSDCEQHAADGDTYGGSGYVSVGSNPNSPDLAKCAGGCEVRFEGSFTNRVLTGGSYEYFGTGTLNYTGFGCSTGDAPTPAPNLPGNTCAAGQVLANVNGEQKCLAGGTDPVNPNTGETETGPTTETTTEKTTDGSGNTTTTQTSSTNNPDGSVTTKTTVTECDATGDNCTTSSQEETEGGDPLKTFCEENPKSKICTDKEGSFGGSCAGGFLCEGDAIQCAIAREQHIRNCQLWAESEEATLYESVKAGTDSGTINNPALEANREMFTLPGTLDQSHHFTPGCWPDLTVTVMSQVVVLPLSDLCPYLEYMGVILVGCSLLVATKIVFGGI